VKTNGDALPVGEPLNTDEGLTELDAEAVPDEDVVGEALSVLVSVSGWRERGRSGA
jgi:hypothetical protein